jgi:hypothetical protein
VSGPVAERQNRHLFEIIFWQPHFPVEDGDQMLVLKLRRRGRIRSVALEAERVDLFDPQQMFVLSTVRLVAGGAAGLKRRLVQHFLGLHLLVLIRVASQADFNFVGLGKAGLAAGMGVVAIHALSRRAGVVKSIRKPRG